MSAVSSNLALAVPSDGIRRVILQNEDGARTSISLEAAWRIRTPVDFSASDITATGNDTRPDTPDQLVHIPATVISNEASLKKVCSYLEHYKDRSSDRSTYDDSSDKALPIDDWDVSFIRDDQETLTSITCIAHFLGIVDLRAVCVRVLSRMLREDLVQDFRAMLRFPEDASDEDVKMFVWGHTWVEDLW